MTSTVTRLPRLPRLRAIALAASLATSLAPASLVAQQPPSVRTADALRGLPAYVEKAMAEWKVPGAAIAIVRDDSVVFAQGFGARKLGEPARVSPSTTFAIGSSSKAFTAAVVAMLVDEGKLRWDDPATSLLPGFQVYDPYVTRELTVRDLLSHRSGLSRGDLLWYGSDLDRDEILRRVRFLKPTWSLRHTFGYQNIMYLAAGQAAARAAGKPWDDLVRERILAPLGMSATFTDLAPLSRLDDVAQPHAELDDTVRVVSWRNIDNIGPAGSLNSNVLDMAKWVRFQLAGGKVGGRSLVSAGNFGEMHMPHTVIRLEGPQRLLNPETHLMNYGLGWFLQDYRGRLVVQHGGNIDGMSALVAMMPEEKVGMVILTNMNGSALPSVLMHRVFDAFVGAPSKDWSADRRKAFDAQQKQAKEAQANVEKQRVAGTKPSLPLAQYAGTYADSMYGEAVVRADGERLTMQYGKAFVGDLEHWHHDTFRATWRDRMLGRSFVTFSIDATAKASKLEVEGIGEFGRVAPKADTTGGVAIAESDMRRLVGKFGAQGLPIVVEVQLVGGKLKLTVPGQPPYDLVALSPTRFRLAGSGIPEGFFFEYTMEAGAVKAARLEQPAPRPTLMLAPVK